MNSVKAWLLRWLGGVSVSEFRTLCGSVEKLARELDSHTLESQAAIGEVISELNAMRNSIPVATQSTHRPVRVLRNFREFRTVIEGQPKPIRIERTS